MQLVARWSERIFEPGTLAAPACHAPTLLELPGARDDDEDLLCAFFAGSREGEADVSIWTSERRGGRWSQPEPLPRAEASPHWNPVLFAHAGRAQLYFKAGPTPRRWRTWRCTRPLEGGAWSAPEELVPGDVGGRGPVKNKPIRLADGAVLAPASLETRLAWDCFTDRSEDGGRSWRHSPLVPIDRAACGGRGIIQPTLWESSPGRVHMLTRSTGGRIYRADSADGGLSWGEARPTALPNNDSGIDLARLAGGALALAYNPVAERRVRTPLRLAISEDAGERFRDAVSLEDGPGEYSYPAVIATRAGLAVAYTWNRRSIAVAALSTSA